ncbi:MAG: hypothetical protein AB1498_12100 [bacterium]
MRNYNYDSFIKEKKDKFFSLRAELRRKRNGVSRLRSRDERNCLILWNKARWEKMLSSGELVEIGPRAWRVKL